MAKQPRSLKKKLDPEDEETPAIRAATDMDVLPGETIDQWVDRKNAEEGVGPDGRYTYDSNTPIRVRDDYDPNMGSL